MRVFSAVVTGVSLLTGGCASTQLNSNTLELASSAGDLIQNQVLDNLSRFIDSDLAIPSMVRVQGGAASTTNTLSPSTSGPLTTSSVATTGLTTVLNAAGVLTSATATATKQISRGAATFTVGGTNAGQQNWSYDTLAEWDQLRRLAALYRYGVGNEIDLEREYPVITTTRQITRNVCRDAHGRENEQKGTTNTCVESGSESYTVQVPDERFLLGPGCVLCIPGGQQVEPRWPYRSVYSTRTIETEEFVEAGKTLRKGYKTKMSIRRLKRNPRLTQGWLRWKSSPRARRPSNLPGPDDISLGWYGNYELYVKNGCEAEFAEFIFFVMSATAQSAASAGGQGSGGASRGGARSTSDIPLTLSVQ